MDIFDRVALVNLDKRKDRLGAWKAKIALYPSLHKYIRYRAIEGNLVTAPSSWQVGGGGWGCRQSHLRVLEDAMMDGTETLCVFEDDVRLAPNFETKLQEFLKLVPDTYEGLMLGGQDQYPGTTSIGIDGIEKCNNTQRTHAYVVRGLDSMRVLYRIWAASDRHIDHLLSHWQSRCQVYQPVPFLCGQDETSSDISGRENEIVKFWNLNPINTEGHPIILLVADRPVAESLCNFGFHFGYLRDSITGLDKGLCELEKNNWPTNSFREWADNIVGEALERGGIPGIWYDSVTELDNMPIRLKRPVLAVRASSIEDAVKQIPELLPHWKASKIIWCWRGKGHDVIEGLKYHGWHRGYYNDSVSGLDNSIRILVENNRYSFVPQIVKQLNREITRIRYGKVLLAHPELNIDRVREELNGYEVHELIGDNAHDIMLHSVQIVNESLAMYKV